MEFSHAKRKGAVIDRASKLRSEGFGAKRILVLVVTSAAASSVSVVSVFVFGHEVPTSKVRSLNLVDPIFALSEFTQLFHLVPSEAWRQPFNRHVGPRSAVSRSPEPMVAMEIVVAAADEKDVIGNTYGYIHLGLRQQDHCWRRVHNDGR